MTKIKTNLLLFTVIMICSLIFAELFLAFMLPQKTLNQLVSTNNRRIYCPSETMPYALKPNATGMYYIAPEIRAPIKINSHGYRDDEFEIKKSGQFRILAIGDSFTFGHGCTASESYPEVIERSLSRNFTKDRIEVINAGFAACYYPDTYYLYLKEKGLDLAPDLILVGFLLATIWM